MHIFYLRVVRLQDLKHSPADYHLYTYCYNCRGKHSCVPILSAHRYAVLNDAVQRCQEADLSSTSVDCMAQVAAIILG